MSSAFTPAQQANLAAVLDELVPPSADGRMPGAGALGLVAHVERGLAQMAFLISLVQQALDALDRLAATRGAPSFASLAPGARREVFAAHAAAEPGFVGPLVFHTYTGYYQQPQVLAALGLAPRPPHPQGHVLEPGDFGGLDAVRARGPIWRAV